MDSSHTPEPEPEVASDWEPDPSTFESEEQPAILDAAETSVTAPKVEDALAHWSRFISDFQTSSGEYYEALAAAIVRRDMPKVDIFPVSFSEGGIVDANRVYLRITRGDLKIDVCAAPYGTGYFFSWWRSGRRDLWWIPVIIIAAFSIFMAWKIQEISFVARIGATVILALFFGIVVPLVHRLLKRITYYRVDTTLMFQAAVHAAVTEVIDGLLTAKGLRALTEDEKKPIMRDFMRR